MNIEKIASHRESTNDGTIITLTAHVMVEAQMTPHPLTIQTKPYLVPFPDAPERTDDKILENEDEELWDFKFMLRNLGFDEEAIEAAPFVRGGQ